MSDISENGAQSPIRGFGSNLSHKCIIYLNREVSFTYSAKVSRKMIHYILEKILRTLIVFFIMSILFFALYSAIAADAVGSDVEPSVVEAPYSATYANSHHTGPTYIGYVRWMSAMFRLDFGRSSRYQCPAIDAVRLPFIFTVKMNIFAVLLGLLIATPLGISSAVKKDSLFDNIIKAVSTVMHNTPVFILTLVIMYFFGVKWKLFPLNGMETLYFKGTAMELWLDRLKHLVLPLFVMTIVSICGLVGYVRAAMKEVLAQGYVKTAYAKGLGEKTVILSHAWKNALFSLLAVIVRWVKNLFFASFVIESMFNLNGVGKLYFDSLFAKDYSVVLAILILIVFFSLVGNLLMALGWGIANPRIRINE